jgi:hypothetical protein
MVHGDGEMVMVVLVVRDEFATEVTNCLSVDEFATDQLSVRQRIRH